VVYKGAEREGGRGERGIEGGREWKEGKEGG
jgi:hypothetical protein